MFLRQGGELFLCDVHLPLCQTAFVERVEHIIWQPSCNCFEFDEGTVRVQISLHLLADSVLVLRAEHIEDLGMLVEHAVHFGDHVCGEELLPFLTLYEVAFFFVVGGAEEHFEVVKGYQAVPILVHLGELLLEFFVGGHVAVF